MRRHVKGGLRAVALASALTTAAALAAPAAHADEPVPAPVEVTTDDAPTASIGEAVDDTLATTTDVLDGAAAGCLPYVHSWQHIWKTPTRYTTANGSVWYRESGGATPRIICPGTVRLTAYVMDETATSPVVWHTYRGKTAEVFSSGAYPSIIASVDVPYTGWDAADVLVVGDTPLPRPYGQVTVRVEVERRLSTGRYSMLPNGCMEFYYLIQPEAGFAYSPDPTRGESATSCYSKPKTLAYDTLDNTGLG